MVVHASQGTTIPTGAEGFRERLRVVMKGESIASFATKCDINSQTIKKYLTSETTPGIDKVLAISKGTGASLNWLITGEGTPYPGLLSEEDIARWWMSIAELLTMEHKRQIISDFHRYGVEGVFKQPPAMTDRTKADWEEE